MKPTFHQKRWWGNQILASVTGRVRAGLDGLVKKIPVPIRFQTTAAPRFVIEVGESLVKGLLMEPSDGRWIPKKFSMQTIGADSSSLPVEWMESFGPELKRAKVRLILPRQAIAAQILELPSSESAEIADMIRLQMGKITPYAASEVESSHLVLETTTEGYARVMNLVVKKEAIAQAVNLAASSGLEIGHVMVNGEAITRWIGTQKIFDEALHKGQHLAVLDVDAALSEFLVVSGAGWEFTRAIPIGLSRLIQEPQRWLEKLIEEVRFSIGLYQGEAAGKGRGVDRLVLLGPEEPVKSLADRLREVEVPVEWLNPLSNFELPVTSEPGWQPASLTALMGAGAMAEVPKINFLPPDLMLRQMVEQRGYDIAKMGILLVALLTLLSLILIEKLVIGNRILSQVSQQVEVLAPQATEVEKAKMRIRFAQSRMGGEASALRLLDRLYRAVPDDMILTAVRLEAGKELSIKGYSQSMSRIFEFVTTLERLPIFGRVKTRSVAKRRFGNQELADFDLVCELAAQKSKEHP